MPFQAFSPFSLGLYAVIAVVSTVYILFKSQNESSHQHRPKNSEHTSREYTYQPYAESCNYSQYHGSTSDNRNQNASSLSQQQPQQNSQQERQQNSSTTNLDSLLRNQNASSLSQQQPQQNSQQERQQNSSTTNLDSLLSSHQHRPKYSEHTSREDTYQPYAESCNYSQYHGSTSDNRNQNASSLSQQQPQQNSQQERQQNSSTTNLDSLLSSHQHRPKYSEHTSREDTYQPYAESCNYSQYHGSTSDNRNQNASSLSQQQPQQNSQQERQQNSSTTNLDSLLSSHQHRPKYSEHTSREDTYQPYAESCNYSQYHGSTSDNRNQNASSLSQQQPQQNSQQERQQNSSTTNLDSLLSSHQHRPKYSEHTSREDTYQPYAESCNYSQYHGSTSDNRNQNASSLSQQQPQQNSQQERQQNSSTTNLDSLLSGNQGCTSEDNCTICQQTLGANKPKFMLACFHLFHKNCLKSHVETIRTCPICTSAIHQNLINKIKI